MCRMMCVFGPKKQYIPEDYLKTFIKNCHRGNWVRQDWLGHHAMGWGVAWRNNNGEIRTSRYLEPIWKSQWSLIGKIKSDFIAIHARFAFEFNEINVHPIEISHNNTDHYIFHNGIFKSKSFPELKEPILNEISQNTKMDTRKYLATYLDNLDINNNELKAINKTNQSIKLFNSGNCFLFNKSKLFINSYHKSFSPMLEKYTYDLNYKKLENGNICISVLPFEKEFKVIPNNTSIQYDFQTKKTQFKKLTNYWKK